MTKQQMTDLVTAIVERVYGNKGITDGCAPVQLQIGYIYNVVHHDGIVITDAPPVITDVVMDWIDKQDVKDYPLVAKASAGHGGLLIR
jgi:hypothetical protein